MNNTSDEINVTCYGKYVTFLTGENPSSDKIYEILLKKCKKNYMQYNDNDIYKYDCKIINFNPVLKDWSGELSYLYKSLAYDFIMKCKNN
jgi:hypothetical protein